MPGKGAEWQAFRSWGEAFVDGLVWAGVQTVREQVCASNHWAVSPVPHAAFSLGTGGQIQILMLVWQALTDCAISPVPQGIA